MEPNSIFLKNAPVLTNLGPVPNQKDCLEQAEQTRQQRGGLLLFILSKVTHSTSRIHLLEWCSHKKLLGFSQCKNHHNLNLLTGEVYEGWGG